VVGSGFSYLVQRTCMNARNALGFGYRLVFLAANVQTAIRAAASCRPSRGEAEQRRENACDATLSGCPIEKCPHREQATCPITSFPGGAPWKQTRHMRPLSSCSKATGCIAQAMTC